MLLSMQLVGNSCKTSEILLHIFGGTSSLLHQAEPAFEPAFATLSLVTYVAHQNNDFFLSENRKKASFFSSRFLYRVGTTNYYQPGQGKTKGSTFQTFFLLLNLLLFLHVHVTLSMDHLKFQSSWLWKKLLKVKGYIKGFKNC